MSAKYQRRSHKRSRDRSRARSREERSRGSRSSAERQASRDRPARRSLSKERLIEILEQIREFITRQDNDPNLHDREHSQEVRWPEEGTSHADEDPAAIAVTASFPPEGTSLEEPPVAQADRGVVPGMSSCRPRLF